MASFSMVTLTPRFFYNDLDFFTTNKKTIQSH